MRLLNCCTVLWWFNLASTLVVAQVIEVQVNNTPSDADDYVTWTPMRAQIRQVGGASNLSVKLESSIRNSATLSELQAIDPRVTIPYWKFDEPAPKLFTRKFIGIVTSTSAQVQFDDTNPIRKWAMPSQSAIDGMSGLITIPLSTEKMPRARNASVSVPDVDFGSVAAGGDHTTMRFYLENNYHNEAHNHIGGWLSTGASPRDPLFFLLHANVDRGWAEWQNTKNKFDPAGSDGLAYSPLNGYPGPTVSNRRHYGNYSKDTMWPWNGNGGNQNTVDTLDDWPNYFFSMPIPLPNHGPGNQVFNFIDYLDVNGKGTSHGSCYDVLPYK